MEEKNEKRTTFAERNKISHIPSEKISTTIGIYQFRRVIFAT